VSRRRTRRRLLRFDRARLGDELCRKSRNRSGQSARGSADDVPRSAAGLGKILFRHHDCAEGCNAPSAVGVSPRARRRLSHGRLQAFRRHAVVVAAARQSHRPSACVPKHPPHDRARPLPRRLHRRRADRAGSDPSTQGDGCTPAMSAPSTTRASSRSPTG